MTRIAAILAILLLILIPVIANLGGDDGEPVQLRGDSDLGEGPPQTMGPTGRVVTIEDVEFVEISSGHCQIGTHFLCGTRDHPARGSNECPPHTVQFPRGFWIARTEVSNAQFEKFEPDHARPWQSPGEEHPVVQISWAEAKAYCSWLGKRSGLPVRLPSEAEWECACRASAESEFCFGPDEERLAKWGWFNGNAGDGTRPVGLLRPNAWGLYDMHGNVWEWCEDTYHRSYAGAPSTGSPWVEGGEVALGQALRVRRGGNWLSLAAGCRSAVRSGSHPEAASKGLGFRPAFLLTSDADERSLRRNMQEASTGK